MKKKQTICDELTAVISTVGELTYEDCRASVENQYVRPAHIEEVRNVSPLHRAYTMRLKKAKTKYYIQVDADMILNRDCTQILLREMQKDPKCFLVRASLVDDVIGLTGSVKLFNRKLIGGNKPKNTIGCDREFEKRMLDKGYILKTIDIVLGRHITSCSKERAFFIYLHRMEKCRVFYGDPMLLVNKIVEHNKRKERKDWTFLSQYALAGCYTGLYTGKENLKREKNALSLDREMFQQADQELMHMYRMTPFMYAIKQARHFERLGLSYLARHYYLEAVNIEGESRLVEIYNAASALEKMKFYVEAEKVFLRIARRRYISKKQKAGAWFHLASISQKQRNIELARERYGKCLQYEPKHKLAAAAIGK